MKYEIKIRPRLGDYNRNGKISMEGILHMIGTAGQHHSDSVRDGVVEGSLAGIAWILTEWNIKILIRPEIDEEYTVETWARSQRAGVPTSIVARDFVMRNGCGEECVLASSKFVLMNLATGKLARITPEMMEVYRPEETSVIQAAPGKLRMPEHCDSEVCIPKLREDIDFNGHVHNSRYMSYALEALPHDIYLEDNINSVRIEYRNPVFEEDVIRAKAVCISDAGGAGESSYIVGIYNQDEKMCSIIKIGICKKTN